MSIVGKIAKIQNYSTKDGPGLRTTVFMMGCNLRCAWCANPEMLNAENSVMFFKERCRSCGECTRIAKVKKPPHDGWWINPDGCENIQEVVQGCPYDAYEMTGFEMDVDHLVAKLLRDEPFFKTSGGGVTFSGGEAALQSDFIYACCVELKKHDIHICLDTAGLVPFEVLEKLLPVIDIILYDIKAFDEGIHQRCTEVKNQLILDNAIKLAEYHQSLIIRFIIVPNYNDQEEDILNRLAFIKKLGSCVKQVDLLPYHILGVGKYLHLGMNYPLENNLKIDDNRMKEWIATAKQLLECPITIGA